MPSTPPSCSTPSQACLLAHKGCWGRNKLIILFGHEFHLCDSPMLSANSQTARCTWLGRGCQVWLDKNLQIFRGTRRGDAAYLMIISCWIIVDFFHLRSPQPMKKCCSLRRAEGASSVSLLITWSASTYLSKHKARKFHSETLPCPGMVFECQPQPPKTDHAHGNMNLF